MRKITIIFGTITFTLCRNCCQFKYWKLSKPCTLWKFWFWQERSFRSGRSDDQNVSSQIYFALKKRRSSLVGKGNYSKCITTSADSTSIFECLISSPTRWQRTSTGYSRVSLLASVF